MFFDPIADDRSMRCLTVTTSAQPNGKCGDALTAERATCHLPFHCFPSPPKELES
jgi:hypothetical protein